MNLGVENTVGQSDTESSPATRTFGHHGTTTAGPTTVIFLDGSSLSVEDVAAVARGGAQVELSAAPEVWERIDACCRLNRELVAQGRPIYGVTTGVGDSVDRHVAADRAAVMQHYLVRKCGCGSGPALADDSVRAAILVRANCLAKGNSGVRPVVIERLLAMLNLDLLPVIPSQGSVGASGDLIPGSYIAAALVGERQVKIRGKKMSAAEAWAGTGHEPLRLEPKEGLALLNGTMVMSGMASLAVLDAERLAQAADVCTALTCEVLGGIRGAFDPFLHQVKPHPGQVRSAERLCILLADSRLARPYEETVAGLTPLQEGFRKLPVKIQDKYSLRCAPHCIGALYDTALWVRRWLEVEINSTNDNPIFEVEAGRVLSGGNFSGFHVGLAMDSLKTAVASVADLLDRQVALLVDEKFNQGLGANLTVPLADDHPEQGIFHGFKAVQMAMSALAAEALHGTLPMTVFSRSTECHNQDKVSMATTSARQARSVIELTERCVALHLLSACQAADLRGADQLGKTRRVYDRVRAVSRFVERDRELDGDLSRVCELLRDGTLLAEVDG